MITIVELDDVRLWWAGAGWDEIFVDGDVSRDDGFDGLVLGVYLVDVIPADFVVFACDWERSIKFAHGVDYSDFLIL